ncbi:MAG: hypothetical protein K8S98_02090 [Planctomycetes bacterium]|nr:hypothetical protein [Planctomycetota bacterium]
MIHRNARILFLASCLAALTASVARGQELRMTSFQWQTFAGGAPGPCVTSAGNFLCPTSVDTTQPPYTVATTTPGLCYDPGPCPLTVTDDVTVDVTDSHNQNYVRSHWKAEPNQVANPIECTFDLDMRGKQTPASGKGKSNGRAIVTYTALPEHSGVTAPSNRLTSLKVHITATVQARTGITTTASAVTTLTAKRSNGSTIHTQTATSVGSTTITKTFDATFDLVIGDFFTLEFTGDADSGGNTVDFARAELLSGTITASQIFDIDLHEAANELALHTDGFKKSFVVRRGGPVDLDVFLGSDFNPTTQEVKFQATHKFDAGSTIVDIPPFTTAVPHDKWGVQSLSLVPYQGSGSKQTRKASLRLNIADNAAVGEYQLQAQVVPTGGSSPVAVADLEKPLPVLFNPWISTDATYFSPTTELAEYVLNESTTLFVGGSSSAPNPVTWPLGQFDANEVTLSVTMGLLSGLSSADRADPQKVARFLTAKTNSEEDAGVLVGLWPTNGLFPGGASPGSWPGSLSVLQQYKSSSAPVKYGQCWVFAGILTSVCRCVGLPARAITVYEAGIDSKDSPGDRKITRHFDPAIHFVPAKSDSSWNFHVWAETHLGSSWYLIDSSRNDDLLMYKLGPVSADDIRAKVAGGFDLNFAIAEVDADQFDVLENAAGTVVKTSAADSTAIGTRIVTAVPGSSALSDLTLGHYKNAALQIGGLASGLDLSFVVPSTIGLGQDIPCNLVATNPTGVAVAITVALRSYSANYHGDFVANLAENNASLQLAPGQTQSVPLLIPHGTYAPWTGVSRRVTASAIVDVTNSPDLWVDSGTTELTLDTLTLGIAPSHVAAIGSTSQLAIGFTNTTGAPLTNVQALVSVTDELSVAGSSTTTVSFGNVAPGATANSSLNVFAKQPGFGLVRVALQASELEAVLGETDLRVVDADCNDNQIADIQDILAGTSVDGNLNGVPDECECLIHAYCSSTANSSGNAATLSAVGSGSVSANNLALVASGCPIGKAGLVCVGDAQQQIPFGDGFICVAPRGAALLRLAPVVRTDAQGSAQVAVNVASPPLAGLVTPSSTWNFQFWFRDLSGPGGTGSNLTNAVSVTFCP